MAKFTAGLTTSAGSTTLPNCALVGSASARIRIYEIGIFNTTTTAVPLQLVRLSTAGTPGASATSRLLDGSDTQAAVGVLKNTYTSTAPTTADLGIRFSLGAAIGSGLVLSFSDNELVIPAVANAAIGFLVDTGGTGQAVQVWMRWIE
jgi:hypothetical protein